MNNQISGNETSWTWSAQLGTYRFWGLFAFYLLSSTSMVITATSVKSILSLDCGYRMGEIRNLLRLMTMSGVLGFFLAWELTRGKAVRKLLMVGVFQLLGLLLVVVSSWSPNIYFTGAGMIFFGMGTATVFIGVPTLLAGGRGGSEAFVIPFGILLTVASLAKLLSSPASVRLLDAYGCKGVVGAAAASVFLGILFLLPVKRTLFDEPPGRDGTSPVEK